LIKHIVQIKKLLLYTEPNNFAYTREWTTKRPLLSFVENVWTRWQFSPGRYWMGYRGYFFWFIL